MKILEVGDRAPNFNLPSDKNEQVSLQSLQGKKCVLFFYPKDNTPGCTIESCNFNSSLEEFATLNTQVIGISKDSLESHHKFRKRYDLRFPLLADEGGKVCDLYNVLVEKSMFGKKYWGIERSTFLIDEQGIIRALWRKVSVAGHVKEVLQKIESTVIPA